jgi:hypothetical protein
LPETSLDPATLETRIQNWVGDEERLAQARQALQEWDVADSVQSIVKIIGEARASR